MKINMHIYIHIRQKNVYIFLFYFYVFLTSLFKLNDLRLNEGICIDIRAEYWINFQN